MADIEVQSLCKRYGGLTAVDSVSFSVERGEIFGLLGPNGAGKTTTLEMLEGLRVPDGGSATVLGSDIVREARRIKQRIGVQLQAAALPPLTTVREAIQLFGSLFARSRDTDELLAEFNLEEKAKAYTNKLSGGQLQRLSIALALVNDPELVFLDEPTTGLDPQARLNLWGVIEGVRAKGRTVVLTTHYMEEAERLCDRVAVMDHGRIQALDTPAHLIATHAPGTVIEFDAIEGLTQEQLAGMPGVEKVTLDRRTSVTTDHPELVLRELLDPGATWAHSDASGAGVRDLRVHQGTLEDVFINVTGGALRE